MQFLFPTLTWGFLLVLLPVLIHLINRLRHQRVQWAAMQFLMASYKKHQRWVWLKQLLLLVMRMLIVAAVVAMLAHLVTQDQWLSWFGGQTTHHIVLLDDSLSMSDRSQGGVSAFDRARDSLRQLVNAALQSGQPQKLTVLRYSRAARAAQLANSTKPVNETPETNPDGKNGSTRHEGTVTSLADVLAAPVNAALEQAILGDGSAAGPLIPTDLAVGLEPALDVVGQLLGTANKDRCVLHVLSDFRQPEWEKPDAIQERLHRLSRQKTEIHLIRCAADADPNLAVVSLHPDVGTQAAGVPLFMNVAIKNFGDTAAERVALKVRSVLHPTGPSGVESNAQSSELPGVIIDRIEPGETVTRQFQVFFPTPGEHTVEVQLPNDALRSDNVRWCVLPLKPSETALVIDGDPSNKASFYLETIFQPGNRAKTGVTPNVQPASYLRDVSPEELASYQAIYLLNIPPLDDRSETNLQQYLQQGGGVAVFLGPQQNPAWFTKAFEKGWFPAPLDRLKPVEATADSDAGQLQFGNHPIFRALTGQENPFAASIRVEQYLSVPARWQAEPDSGVEVLARLRNGSPLVIERSVGAGHCVTFLTSLAPEWNNWAMEPSFVVVALQLHAYLTATQRPAVDHLVGQSFTWQFDGGQYRPEVIVTAAANTEGAREWTKVASPPSQDNPMALTATVGSDPLSGVGPGETEVPGVYDAQLETLQGDTHHRRWAMNVSTQDSTLQQADAGTLRQKLAPVRVDIRSVDQGLNLASLGQANAWNHWLLGAALLMLIAEQFLAYRFSYHVSSPLPAGGTLK